MRGNTNPGSPKAKRLGCTCSPLDNWYGEGAVIDGHVDSGQFFIADDCPIHADSRRLERDRDDSGEGSVDLHDGQGPADHDDSSESQAGSSSE